MNKFLSWLFAVFFVSTSYAQVTFPVNGIPVDFKGSHAYTNAVLHIDHARTVHNATLVVRDGRIVAAGANAAVPRDAVVTDLKGQHVYPAFVDLLSGYGVKPDDAAQRRPGPQFLSNKGSIWSWNQALRPEENAVERFRTDSLRANALRGMGYGLVVTHTMDGIMRGTGALVFTGNGREALNVIAPQAATFFAFERGLSTQDYPTSLMGAIALLRQSFYDARWYKATGGTLEQNLSLDALNRTEPLPRVFHATSVQNALRANRIAGEFNRPFVIAGNGDEYQMINEIRQTNATFVIPLTYPLPYDLNNLDDAAYVPLSVMKHWEMAPFNARILHENNVSFCISAHGFDDPRDFLNNLRLAVNNGLPRAEALKALTTTPAAVIGLQNEVGSLEPGKRAAFFVANGDLFADTTSIVRMFIHQREYTVTPTALPNASLAPGHYRLTVNELAPFDLVIDDDPRERKPYIMYDDTTRIPVVIRYDQPFVSFEFVLPGQPAEQPYVLRGYQSDTLIGGETAQTGGARARWSAVYAKPYTRSEAAKAAKDSIPPVPAMLYPFQGYGWTELPKQEDVLFRNATVWTNERDGILQNTDVLLRNGKIHSIGPNLAAGSARVIDATGKHLTAGIVDEHSHIAITHGVNEASQSVTSEVRIGDVLNSRDVNIYRQLAGGVTSSHLLHGSANSIGGQTQLIKLRWGAGPEQLKFERWPGFIKFALGENVKQSNWGDFNTTRFPQSRMGVEQVFYDAFTRAKQYQSQWDAHHKSKGRSRNPEPRRDLELDALVEILNKQRFITCHSYVQSEINMLMHVGDSMGFRVNTFTHILEGYKVADKMKEHGAHASSFSDWWGFKYEVYDAIPHNGAILHKMGVNTAFNSDDPEMARRLNQEAAKAVKYGGLSEEDAWKFVTLNPAIMLHIADRVGSIKPGKDADVVLWSTNPLHVAARAERTYVDGICYYNLEEDQRKRDFIRAEKSRLVGLMQQAKKAGVATKPFEPQFEHHYHCDTVEAYDFTY